MDDLDSAAQAVLKASAQAAGAPDAAAADVRGLIDGPGSYELVGFISHMGRNTACGHYVCHIKKDGR